MKTFGFDNGTLERLIVAVSDEGSVADCGIDARFAAAAWSALVEPGDGTAGALIAAIGPAAALTALIEAWSPRRIIDAARKVGDGETDALEAELSDALKRWRPRLRSDDIVRSLEQAARVGATLVVRGDSGWPGALDDLGKHGPLVLWRRGSARACESTERSFALVGARAATTYGEHVTMEASAGLVRRGFTIVSGAAYGIDGMAHRAALVADGATVAILAGGVDRFYPSGHDGLLRSIARTGAVISEMPCQAAPTKWRFLQRNRLIAAMSTATVVVEAGHRSGSLNTAGHASALGRPLGAVPGPVTSPASAGCHRLIRDYAAMCVTNVDEMIELVDGADEATVAPARNLDRTPDEIRVIDALSARSPRTVSDIAARCGLSVAAASSVLGVLDLEGAVAERERGWVRV